MVSYVLSIQATLLSKVEKLFQPLLKFKALNCTRKWQFTEVLSLSIFIAIISQEEFIEGALNDEWIREMLECDPNTVKMERPLKGNTVL